MARRAKLTELEKWEKAQNTLRPGETPVDRALFSITLAQMGQHCTFTEDGHPGAVLPTGQISDEEWEARSIAMHEAQEAVRLEDKPAENTYSRGPHTLSRGD